MKRMLIKIIALVLIGIFVFAGCSTQKVPEGATNAELQKQIKDIIGVLPKFAVPMREVGDRFENIYTAAKGGNWALAAYMSKYMNKAMNPATLTKPNEYPAWTTFYTGAFDPVNKAIEAKDFAALDKAYTDVIDSCNGCHASMGYKYVKIVKVTEPANTHFDYNLSSEPGEVKK